LAITFRATQLERDDVVDLERSSVDARDESVLALDPELLRLGHVADVSGAKPGAQITRLVSLL
jgi:hypothetical protein